MTELRPTKEHLEDSYVLQLIEALSKQQDDIEEYQERTDEIIVALGSSGILPSGIVEKIEELKERDTSREGAEHYGPYGANCMYSGQFDAGECWLCYAKRKKQEAGEMQLVAGRYQHLHEQAQKALNKIDDLFEYQYKTMTPEQIRRKVYEALAGYTKVVSGVVK